MIPRVIVIVRGGFPDVYHKDKGVEVVIVDYDNEGTDPHASEFNGEKASVDTLSADDEILNGVYINYKGVNE